jgi:hypothetical protein
MKGWLEVIFLPGRKAPATKGPQGPVFTPLHGPSPFLAPLHHSICSLFSYLLLFCLAFRKAVDPGCLRWLLGEFSGLVYDHERLGDGETARDADALVEHRSLLCILGGSPGCFTVRGQP